LELESEEHAGAELEASFLGEVEALHLPERVPGEHAVGGGLVAPPRRALHLERGGDALEPAVEAAEAHHVLDVVDLGPEVDAHVLEELGQRPRQLAAHEDLDEVGEVVGGVEGDPRHLRVADEARGHEQRGEGARADAPGAVRGQVDAAGGEEGDGVRGVAVEARVELAEVDLEGERGRGGGGGGEGESDLDEVERVDVGLDEGVALGGGHGGGVLGGAVDDPRELGVHGHVGEVLDGGADELELAIHVVRPNLPDLQLVVVVVLLLPPAAGGEILGRHLRLNSVSSGRGDSIQLLIAE
jgi:hypothetical protein